MFPCLNLWSRFPCSSYSVVCQFVALELHRRGVEVAFQDAPLYQPAWQRQAGLWDPAREHTIRSLPAQLSTNSPDATLVFSFPLNLTAAAGPGLTIVAGTTENQIMTASRLADTPLQSRGGVRYRTKGAIT